jgi:hypothetical protein
MKPIQTIQNTTLETSCSALGMSATRSISVAPRRCARRSKRSEASSRATMRRARRERKNPTAKMMAAAINRGMNWTKAVAKLCHDCASASAIS